MSMILNHNDGLGTFCAQGVALESVPGFPHAYVTSGNSRFKLSEGHSKSNRFKLQAHNMKLTYI